MPVKIQRITHNACQKMTSDSPTDVQASSTNRVSSTISSTALKCAPNKHVNASSVGASRKWAGHSRQGVMLRLCLLFGLINWVTAHRLMGCPAMNEGGRCCAGNDDACRDGNSFTKEPVTSVLSQKTINFERQVKKSGCCACGTEPEKTRIKYTVSTKEEIVCDGCEGVIQKKMEYSTLEAELKASEGTTKHGNFTEDQIREFMSNKEQGYVSESVFKITPDVYVCTKSHTLCSDCLSKTKIIAKNSCCDDCKKRKITKNGKTCELFDKLIITPEATLANKQAIALAVYCEEKGHLPTEDERFKLVTFVQKLQVVYREKTPSQCYVISDIKYNKKDKRYKSLGIGGGKEVTEIIKTKGSDDYENSVYARVQRIAGLEVMDIAAQQSIFDKAEEKRDGRTTKRMGMMSQHQGEAGYDYQRATTPSTAATASPKVNEAGDDNVAHTAASDIVVFLD